MTQVDAKALANEFVSQVHGGWALAHFRPRDYDALTPAGRRTFLNAIREAGLIQRPDKLWEAPPEVVNAALEAQRVANPFAGRTMTVSRLAGDYSASLCLDDRDSTELHSAGLGDKSALMAEIALRWNEHAELLEVVRQVAKAETGTLLLDCAPTAARNLLNRLGRTEG
jgi:hypothetical protein